MKKVILNSITLIFAVVMMSSCGKEKTISTTELPSAAQLFLSEHFVGVEVAQSTSEKEGLSGREYTVILKNGVEVGFNKSGDWTDVDGPNSTAIPTTFIHTAIVSYVAENYSASPISAIEKTNTGFDVELTNDLELVFNKNGNFIRVD